MQTTSSLEGANACRPLSKVTNVGQSGPRATLVLHDFEDRHFKLENEEYLVLSAPTNFKQILPGCAPMFAACSRLDMPRMRLRLACVYFGDH